MTFTAATTPPRTTTEPPGGVCRQGDEPPDPQAFVQFSREQIPGTWARTLRVRPHDADDLVQDALLIVLDHWRDVPPQHRQAYFATVIRNEARHLFRRERLVRKFEPLLHVLLRERCGVAWPDENLLRKQVVEAAYWLVAQVAESRRDVAERRLLDGQEFEDIVRDTGKKAKTVYSQWDRARADMRKALDRETKKQGSTALLAAAAALLAGVWLRLVARGESALAVLATLRDRVLRRPAAPAVARRTAGPRRGERSGLGALLACVLLPVAVIAHSTSRPLPGSPAVSLTASMVAVARPVHRVARSLDIPRASEIHRLLTYPTVHPERDRAPRTVVSPASPPRPTPPVTSSGGALDAPRGLLLRATMALEKGRADHARLALRDYQRMFPENPLPLEHQRLWAGLRALDAPSDAGIR